MPEVARSEWGERIFALAINCGGSCADDARKRMRTFWHLLTLAPQPQLLRGIAVLPAMRIQALLAAEAFDCAVLETLGSEASGEISFQASRCTARVTLPGDSAEGMCSAGSIALALLGALSLALSSRAKVRLLRVVPEGISLRQR